MKRFSVGRCAAYVGAPGHTYGIDDWEPSPGRRPTRPGHVRIMRTAVRGYTQMEAQQVVDWLNGEDQPLVITQSEADDPLLGQHRKA